MRLPDGTESRLTAVAPTATLPPAGASARAAEYFAVTLTFAVAAPVCVFQIRSLRSSPTDATCSPDAVMTICATS
jgi:hypothetical protein